MLLSFSLLIFISCNNSSTTGYSKESTDSVAVSDSPYKPALLLTLPDSMNTPDGLAINNDGSLILLSTPNHNDPSYRSRIYSLTGNSYRFFSDLPLEPTTHHVCAMDLAFGPDGNVYVNDNQFELFDKNYKSRVLKIIMKNGKPDSVIPIVTGMRLANGMVWKGNDLYVTDSQWDTPQDSAKSAVFHFTLSQLSGAPIHLQPGFGNKYILDTFTTIIGDDKIDNGVDGIDYDSKGNLYTGMFGDGRIFKMTLKADGSLGSKELFVPQGNIASCDGFIIDRKDDKLYVNDSKKNAIKTVTPDGKVSTLWENGDTDGSNGLLDQPSEVLLVGNKLYIANFDKPNGKNFVNTKYDRPNTLSVITLK